ncbi:MAG: CHRD domain-containing protein [bacterium]
MTLDSTWRGRGAFVAIIAAFALGLTMILASAATTSAQTAPSATIKPITLNGGEENPPVTANTTGSFNGTLTDGKLEFDLSAVGDGLTQAHIHMGAKGTNGPVVAFLFGPSDPPVGALHPTGTITVANLVGPLKDNWKGFTDALAKGDLYANVHSTANPGGVVRAQIPPTSINVPLPPNTGTGATGASNDFSLMQAGGVLLVVIAGGVTLSLLSKRRSA